MTLSSELSYWHPIKFDPFWFHCFSNEWECAPSPHLAPTSPSLLSPCPSQRDAQPSVNVSTVCHKWIINGDTLKSRFPRHKTACLSNAVLEGSGRVEREPLPGRREVQEQHCYTLQQHFIYSQTSVCVLTGKYFFVQWWRLEKWSIKKKHKLSFALGSELRGANWGSLRITELLRHEGFQQMTSFDFVLLWGATRWRQRNTNEPWDKERDTQREEGGVNSCVLQVV